MNPFTRSQVRLVSLAAAALCALPAWPGRAAAGLVIEAHPAIDGRRVQDVAIHRGSLVVKYDGGRREVRLPPGALPLIAVWAAGESDGPVVVSVDGAFDPSGGN